MKTLFKALFILTLFTPLTLTAQWTDYGSYIRTDDNIGVGVNPNAGNNNFSLYVRKNQQAWQGAFVNRGGVGAQVYLAHGAGYGMHIRGLTTDGKYTLQLYNKNVQTNVFLNNGIVGLGLAGNVGIGTTNPLNKLHVNGYARTGLLTITPQNNNNGEGGEIVLTGTTGNNEWRIDNRLGKYRLHHSGIVHFMVAKNGYTGIGQGAPKEQFHVGQRLALRSTDTGGGWGGFKNNEYWDDNDIQDNNPKYITNGAASTVTMTDEGDILLRTAATGNANTKVNYKLNMRIENDGGVGINTWHVPDGYELAVSGNIIAGEINIRPRSYWPDYVFKPSYELMSIEEKEAFTKENHHLPSIQSETVITSEGMDVGKSHADLLKEVEEAHLYIFQMNHTIKELQQQIDALKEEVRK